MLWRLVLVLWLASVPGQVQGGSHTAESAASAKLQEETFETQVQGIKHDAILAESNKAESCPLKLCPLKLGGCNRAGKAQGKGGGEVKASCKLKVERCPSGYTDVTPKDKKAYKKNGSIIKTIRCECKDKCNCPHWQHKDTKTGVFSEFSSCPDGKKKVNADAIRKEYDEFMADSEKAALAKYTECNPKKLQPNIVTNVRTDECKCDKPCQTSCFIPAFCNEKKTDTKPGFASRFAAKSTSKTRNQETEMLKLQKKQYARYMDEREGIWRFRWGDCSGL